MKTKINILTLLLTFSFCANLSAQSRLCQDPCPPGPLLYETIPHCYMLDGTNPVPSVFTIIGYRIRNCNGVQSIIVENYVVLDQRNYYEFDLGFTPQPCSLPNPLDEADLRTLSGAAITELVNLNGNSQLGSTELYFKGACHSLVQLKFPSGAFFTTGKPNDLGTIDTTYLNEKTQIFQSVPCDDGCCKITWRYEIFEIENGQTSYLWRPVSVEGDELSCENQPLPDYNNFQPKLEATIYNSITRQYQQVNGSVVNQTNCEISCRYYAAPSPGMLTGVSTDIKSVNEILTLKASPIPFNNTVKLTANKPIIEINVYDIKGRKVLHTNKVINGELNTAELKEGVYYIQVYLEGNVVKTIKVIKD